MKEPLFTATVARDEKGKPIVAKGKVEFIVRLAKDSDEFSFSLKDENGKCYSVPEGTKLKMSTDEITGKTNISIQYPDDYNIDESDIQALPQLLPRLKSTLPCFFTMSNTKLSTELENGLVNDGETGLKVGGTKKRPLVTIVTVTDESDAIHSSKSLTMFQTCVKNAAYSLYKYGHSNHVFTPEMIVRTMNGKTETEYVSPQQVGAVTKALNELSFIRIRIDATQEAKARKAEINGQLIDTYEREGYLLPLERIKISAGGKTVEGYQIIKTPVELEYAEMTRQLITVKSELLDIKKVNKAGKATVVSQKSNDERIAVKMYLLSRIKVMIEDQQRKKPKQSNIILFDTLFEKTGITKDNNSRIYKNYVYDVLDFWTAEKFIKGYTKRKKQGKGGGIDAIIIDL